MAASVEGTPLLLWICMDSFYGKASLEAVFGDTFQMQNQLIDAAGDKSHVPKSDDKFWIDRWRSQQGVPSLTS